MTTAASAPRDISIDTMRAIACLALVSYHTVGASPAVGLELPASHWLAQLNAVFIDMRMPLFSFLSGLVFVRLEHLTRSPGQMALSKMRRLLVPMITVGALFWAARALNGQAQAPLLSLFYLPFAHFWFLQATFVIMALFLLLHWALPGRSTWLAAALLGLGALAWAAGPRPPVNVFSVIQAAYLMPFFMLGYLCAHGGVMRRLRHNVPRWLAGLALIALVAIGAALAFDLLAVSEPPYRRAMTVAIGIGFCLTLLTLAPRHAGLARLGGYSYTIYLFHVFFIAAGTLAVQQVLPQVPPGLLWLVGLALGICGPVALHQMIRQSAWLSTVLLGLRPRQARISANPQPVAHSGREQRA